jgi:hypothetical protein
VIAVEHAPRLGWWLLADGSGQERVELLAVEVVTELRWLRLLRSATVHVRYGYAADALAAAASALDLGPLAVTTLSLLYLSPALHPSLSWRTTLASWRARSPLWVGPSYRRQPAEAWS